MKQIQEVNWEPDSKAGVNWEQTSPEKKFET